MKLIFAIVQNDDSKRLIRALVQHRISVTRISTTGGFCMAAYHADDRRGQGEG